MQRTKTKKRMKRKVLFLLALATSYAAQANAATNDEVAGQYIVTDCGTVYKIPTNATSDQAASLIDLYSEIDCK